MKNCKFLVASTILVSVLVSLRFCKNSLHAFLRLVDFLKTLAIDGVAKS